MVTKILSLYENHIKGRGRKDFVPEVKVRVGNVKKTIKKVIKVKNCKVFATTRSIKHIYDRVFLDAGKPEDFVSIIKKLPQIVTSPDRVCANKQSKRGNFCFIKRIKGRLYLATLETSAQKELHLVTCFMTTEKYCVNFVDLWRF